MNPDISIIVPAYNSECTIQKCLISLMQQSMKNIEIIVINDGSTDHTIEICKKMQENDERIKVITQENKGVSSARNQGLACASGKYVMFVDSDDNVVPEFCSVMYAAIEHNKSDLAICGYYECDKSGQSERLPLNGDDRVGYSFDELFVKTINNGMMNVPWNKIFNRKKINHQFNEKRTIGEDLEFNLQYLRSCNNLIIVNLPLYYYDISSEGSLTKKKYNVFEAKVQVCKMVEEFVFDKKIEFRNVKSRYYAAFISSMKLSFYEKKGFRAFKEDFRYLREKYYLNVAKKQKSDSVLHTLAKYSILFDFCFILYFLFVLKDGFIAIKKCST